MGPPRGVWKRDLAVAAAITMVAEAELLLVGGAAGVEIWPGWALTLLLTLPALALRRLAPLAAAALAAVGLALQLASGEQLGIAVPFLALLFLLATLGWHAPLLQGLLGTGVVLAGGLATEIVAGSAAPGDAVVNVVIIAGAWGAAFLLRRASDRRLLAEVAAVVEAERSARESVQAERTRIAHELHDSLAHALTLITLQAGSAGERTSEPATRDLLGGIESTARAALADLERMLRLVGERGDEAPGIGALPALVADIERCGLAVDLRLDVADGVPGFVASSVYRVVQEGLTNIVRHSGSRRARVAVTRDGQGWLVVSVEDDGPARPSPVDGSGRGLEGLQERLSLLGGALRSGRRAEGWHLEAHIPVEAA